MKINKHIFKVIFPSSGGSLLTDHCSGDFLNCIGRATLLAVVLGVAVVLATGCSSTGSGFNPLLISPLPAAQQSSDLEENGWNQTPRSPAFSDPFGS
jgi:hypothetical protein